MSARVRVVKRVQEHNARLARARKAALTDLIVLAHGDVIPKTPVDSGLLRSSIAYAVMGKRVHKGTATGLDGLTITTTYEVDAPRDTARLGTNVDYAPAVHENRDAKHKVGQSKFIEEPLRANQERYKEAARKRYREEMNKP